LRCLLTLAPRYSFWTVVVRITLRLSALQEEIGADYEGACTPNAPQPWVFNLGALGDPLPAQVDATYNQITSGQDCQDDFAEVIHFI
jgi:hypothetical protein